jgi:Grx4 family monothiol glutaredoxin
LTGFEEQGRVEGSNIPDLLSKTENHSSLFSSIFESLRNSYYSTLQVLINSSKLVVFTQEESSKSLRNRKIRRILNGYLYETIQVDKKKHLSDWLRVYSSSKTFPMVFLGGRFQGSIEEIMKNISTGDFSTAMGEDLNEKLSRIVKSSKYIVFMMGSKEEPICGYSKRLIALLDGYGIDFDTFDISFDGEVCEGLKKFSDWPTYPQVYVDGELIGGYDICNQMHNEGSLKQALGIPE